MDFIIQPWFLILFAVAGFLAFGAIGAQEKYKAEVAAAPLTRWIILGISVVIVAVCVLKVLQIHRWSPFQ